MSTPVLSKLCNSLFGVNDKFDRFKEKPFREQLDKLASISTLTYPPFIYPIPVSDEIHVRLSTLNELRHACIELLDKLPENHEKIIREFLIFTEDAGKPKSSPKEETAVTILQLRQPRPL